MIYGDILPGTFPNPNSNDFSKIVLREWNSLKCGLDNGFSITQFLYQSLKSKRNRLTKDYIFLLWLCLCINREWIEKGIPKINDLINFSPTLIRCRFRISDKTLRQVNDILMELIKDNPPNCYPDASDLRRRLKKPETISSIFTAAIEADLNQTLIDLAKALHHSLSSISNFQIRLNQDTKTMILLAFKFERKMRRKKYITKRDLMIGLRVSKAQLDRILDWANDSIEIKKLSQTTWIFYRGPEKAFPKEKFIELKKI